MTTVRTRFAPSPTGFLHVGGVRTALFSWLFARHHKGQFILRIEDTDSERSTTESIEAILEGMQWLGLDYDEPPYYQTKRYDRYYEVANQWIEEGKAYRCVCSKERLETLRETQLANKEKPRYDGCCRDKNLPLSAEPSVIRFKNPQEGLVSFHDEVYGAIEVSNSELDDLILVRSDGHPTYNFAVVIVDLDMRITHVIRGDDHINNTPRQINLFRALNAPIPVFAHLPMILGDDGKRLSKRHGAVSVLQFKEMGILPHALLNYLVRLGWSHKDQEIFSLQEMIDYFDLAHVSRGVSSFNYDKLHWLNSHYIKTDDPEEVAKALQWHLPQEGIDVTQGPAVAAVVQVLADRAKTLKQMCEMSLYFYKDALDFDEDAVQKHLTEAAYAPLNLLCQRLEQAPQWDKESIMAIVHEVCTESGLNMGKIAQPLRVAVTGSTNSPSIDATLHLLGREKTLVRLKSALLRISSAN